METGKPDVALLLEKALPEGEWVNLAKVTSLARGVDPGFKPFDYGYAKLLPLVQSVPDLVEVRRDNEGLPPIYSCRKKGKADSGKCPCREADGHMMPDLYGKSLFKRHRDQPVEETFAHFPWDGAGGENWETPFSKLADMAMPEDWSGSGGPYAVLRSYLDYTFKRLAEQGKIAFAEDGTRACMNTGLSTPMGKDIYMTFYKNQANKDSSWPDWVLYGFFDSYSDRLACFAPLPEPATYISDAADLVFDMRYDIEINADHVINDNLDRFPETLRESPRLALISLHGAVDLLRERLSRNFRLAVPVWHCGKITLLLPLYLTDDHSPDLAAVAERDDKRRIYRIRTVLTLEMAKSNARQVCPPAKPWL